MEKQDPDVMNDVTNDVTDDVRDDGGDTGSGPDRGRGRLRRRRADRRDRELGGHPGSGAPEEVSLHPEATPDPAVLSWSVSPVRVSVPLDSARGDELPPGLAELVADGTLDRVRVLPGRVVTSLSGEHRWSDDGQRVRERLHADLESEAPWPASSTSTRHPGRPGTTASGSSGPGSTTGDAPDEEDRPDPDDVAMADSVRRLLTGPVGALAAGHGGSIRLYAVHDGVVDVELHGACHGCPAAERTLGRSIEAELRRLHPGVRKVRQVDSHGRPVGPDSDSDDHTRPPGDGFSWLTIGRRH